MPRHLPTYPDDRIAEMVSAAERQTGWPRLSIDTAAVAGWQLAGWQADDVAVAHATDQVEAWQARQRGA